MKRETKKTFNSIIMPRKSKYKYWVSSPGNQSLVIIIKTKEYKNVVADESIIIIIKSINVVISSVILFFLFLFLFLEK